jgi:hypothetical protein
MRKVLLIAVLLFSASVVMAQAQLIRILGQQYSSSGSWVDSSELLFQYNTKGFVSEKTQRNLQGAQPRPQKLDSFFYNNNNQLDVQRKYHWDLNITSWVPDIFSKHNYNSNNLVEVIEHDDYYSLGINKYNDSFWYNSNNKLERKILGNRKNIRWVYTYYSNGLLEADIEQRGNNSNGWFDFIKTENTKYDVNGNLTESIRSYKGSSQPGWKFINRQTSTYDVSDQKLLEVVSEFWQNGAWQLGGKSIYSYNPDKTIKEILRQVYNGSGWDNQSRDSYFYKNSTTGIAPINTNGISFTTYPNPTSGFVTLSFIDNTPREISITDIQGKQLYKTTTNESITTLNISDYAKGIYFIKVADGTRVSTKKLILQ